jgi:hypothetical protein
MTSDELSLPGFVDPTLQVFVSVMSSSGVQLGISVLVGGTWMSGTLIPARMYFQELGDEIAERAGQPGEALRDGFFAELGRTWFPSDSEREAGGGLADEQPAPPHKTFHLHLRHARAWPGGTPIPEDGFYLRVRLDEVAGWTVGELGPPGYRPPGPPAPRDT